LEAPPTVSDLIRFSTSFSVGLDHGDTSAITWRLSWLTFYRFDFAFFSSQRQVSSRLLPLCVALTVDHPLARLKSLPLKKVAEELFIYFSELE
jgi:hypothetical protein